MTAVGFVGLGAMGGRMARRLLGAGHDLTVWNRTPEKADALVAAGARRVAVPAEAARGSELVFTMVSDPKALAAVTSGPDGVLAGLEPGSVLVEMSTVGPEAIHALAEQLPEEVGLLDAPVLGSLSEVEAGRLRVFVGGADDEFSRVEPVLRVLGEPLRVGRLGNGAAAKLVANSTLVGVLCLLGEAVALGQGLGLDTAAVFEVLSLTPLGAQAERRRPGFAADRYDRRFALRLAEKDAGLVASAGEEASVELRLAQAGEEWFRAAGEAGWGELDYSAILAFIAGRERTAG